MDSEVIDMDFSAGFSRIWRCGLKGLDWILKTKG
jgi:hypothetical protein